MLLQRKTKIILALIISSVFLFQNCATLIRGTSQKIPVISNPSGAKIIVDGKEIGYTPLNLKLKRKKSHNIRIEKQGYNPLEISIARKTSTSIVGLSILGNLFLFLPLSTLLDYSSGAYYTFSTKQLTVILSKIEEKSQPNIILIDGERFQNIKWIRIKCADSYQEQDIISLD